MLKNVIENYLISIKEVQFFAPFKVLLETMGFYDIHLLHGSTEFGRDFIAKKQDDDATTQYSFQVKVGNINLSKFTNEVKQQLLEIITNKCSHPNFDRNLKQEIVFVTTGKIQSPATISFQEFNNYIWENLNSDPIVTWEKDKIFMDFYKIGIEPFYELHNSPEFVSRFFDFFTKIKQQHEFTAFEITSYTDYWLSLDLTVKVNKLQVLFEGYFFSKLFYENKEFYSSVLFLSALTRVFVKNDLFEDYKYFLKESILNIINDFHSEYTSKSETEKESFLIGDSFFSIISYPARCLRTLELFSLHLLLSDKFSKKIIQTFNKLIQEKGANRPISDNYGIAFFMTCLVLIKLDQKELLRKYLINTTVWLCDRYSQNGLSPIGYNPQEEYEQIFSEYLSGLDFFENKFSFIAAIILDLCFFLNDKRLYADIANDFRAVEIIPTYFHVNERVHLFDYENIITQTDNDFSLEIKDDFTNYVKYRNEKFSIELNKSEALLLMFQLKDRYFPNIIFDLI